MRRINWGADGTDAKYRTEDAGDPGNFVVAEDLNGNTILLQWNDTTSQWEYGGAVDLGGNDLSSVNVQSFDDAAADPSANGELQRNGTDLKAFSGGAVQNLSNIGSGGVETTVVSSNYTTQDEDVVYVDESAGAVTVTLASADVTNGNEVEVVNMTGTNTVTVDTEGSETIDPGGEASKTITKAAWGVAFVGDGTNWSASVAGEFESVDTEQATIGGLAGTPAWDEESGSPYTATGANSITPSSLDAFSGYLIMCEATDAASSSANLEMQVGGDTGGNYTENEIGGTQNTGQTEWGDIGSMSADATSVVWVSLVEHSGGAVGMNTLANAGGASTVQAGQNASVAWAPSQFTFKRGVSTDWRVRVFGRDV